MAVWPLSKQDMLRLADGHGSLGSQPSLGPPDPHLPQHIQTHTHTVIQIWDEGVCGNSEPVASSLIQSECTREAVADGSTWDPARRTQRGLGLLMSGWGCRTRRGPRTLLTQPLGLAFWEVISS